MKQMRQLTVGLISLAASALIAGPAVSAGKDYVLNTASTGGTYHPVGTAISTLTKIKLLLRRSSA